MSTPWFGRFAVLRSAGLAVALFAASLTIISSPASASTDFTTISPPFTGASDYAIKFPYHSCGLGPLGMIDDGTNFLVADTCSHTLYKFPAASGGNAKATTSFADGLTAGLALSNGTYFGVAGSHVRSFDPATGALVAKVDNASKTLAHCGPLGLVADPLSTDLYVSTFSCGIERVQNPTSGSPTITSFNGSSYDDGIYFTSDGQHMWAADRTNGGAAELDRTGAIITEIHIDTGVDGIAVALGSAGGGVANNVFVNDNNGDIYRIDTNAGNAVSVVASGGTRGDFALTGPDGCLYVTQADRIEKMAPCFFQPPLPHVSIGDVGVYEGEGQTTANFTVSLDQPSSSTVTVSFATADGTATAPGDYTATSGTVTFPPGSTSQTVAVTAQDDADDTGSETFSVNLSSPTKATLGAHASGLGSIIEEQARLDIGNTSVSEGQTGNRIATFTVTLSEAAASTVTVQYATADGTATAPSDYTATSGTLTFPPGTTSRTVGVTVIPDTDGPAAQTFSVNLSSASGATIGNATGLGTINDGN